MTDPAQIKLGLSSLAQHLSTQRDVILRNWQRSVERDPTLTTSSGLSRAQFNDHIPQVLEGFERRLQAQDPTEKDEAFEQQKSSAAEHGLHRWQQGYNQREAIREWSHLHYCILAELERYGRDHVELELTVMPVARRALVRLCGEGVCESAARYDQLQRAEAASRLRDLEAALQQLRILDRQRAETWREAAHDLRGTVGVVSNASMVLAKQAAFDPSRTDASHILQRSVASLRELLTDMMDLARLEAGQERRHVATFDAAEVLRQFCVTMRPLAAQRNLFLKGEGPQSLPVAGDSVKVLRIAQNLVLNALNATEHGGVRVLWEERSVPGCVQQWMLSVQDTGPGVQWQSAAAPLERVLQHATQESHEVDIQAERSGDESAHADPAPTLKSQSDVREVAHVSRLPGEGIGLSIVKRLCELLDASLELETSQGTGTTFRVVLPRAYPLPG